MALLDKRYENDGLSVYELNDVQKEYIRLFNKKCESGEYSYISYPCECSSHDFEIIAKKDRYGIPVKTVICKNCGLIMSNPRLDDRSNALFYDNEYHYIYRAETKPSYEKFAERKAHARLIIDFVRNHSHLTEGRVLEIGCADGGNVAAFSDAGYDAFGIDLSHTYTDFGISHGLHLYCCSSSEVAAKGDKYDLIILHHVLEHFTDLKTELGCIAEMLDPDGLLFIAVPGVKNLTFKAYGTDFLRMLQNAHVYNFTRDTLCQVMKKYGFEALFCNESIYGLFRKGNREHSFNNLYPDIREYLNSVESANGNNGILLIKRMVEILSKYKTDEVLVYGTAYETNVLAHLLNNKTMIRKWLTTEDNDFAGVLNCFNSESNEQSIKCLVLVSVDNDEVLMGKFNTLRQSNIDIYSLYSDSF